jgi:hypothetical protein
MAPFDPTHAATGINLMSALASGFHHFVFVLEVLPILRVKMVTKDAAELSNDKILGIMAAGVVGALALYFF